MRKLTKALLILIVFAGWVQAEEPNVNNATDDLRVSESLCPGNWKLSNLSGWSVRNKEGLILPLTAKSTVLGCDGKQIPLDADLAGASVGIKCAPSGVPNGLPDVLTVNVWCK